VDPRTATQTAVPLERRVPAFPRSLWAREGLVLVATLLGWLVGGVAFAVLWRILDVIQAGPDDPAWEIYGGHALLQALPMGLYVTGFGCVCVFPSALIWLAAFVRADMAIARNPPAVLFGLACGAAAAVAIWVPLGAGAVMLDLESLLFFAAHGALVGAVTWTSYVALARLVGTRSPSD
jgi:hypothetical protein